MKREKGEGGGRRGRDPRRVEGRERREGEEEEGGGWREEGGRREGEEEEGGEYKTLSASVVI